ncbi:MAG TPA: MobF family relaxase [Acidimicrobiales bacterium]|nr:MobF family relaxase [Acidimicrobiales bacterium]
MLRVAKVRRGGHAYYLDVAAQPGHDGIEAPGRWLGGAQDLGLSGPVTAGQLGAVLDGVHPSSGDQLGSSHHRVTVAAYDLTFCSPKSVSLLFALGSEEVASEVRAAHVAAVDAAVRYVADRAVAVRRSVDETRLPVQAEGVAAAGFLHRVSRALDPHLHTHVVMANLGRGPEGAWSALDGRGIYAHAGAAGALFHVQLRYELTSRVGVRWEPLRSGRGDIEGIGVESRRAFSQRAASIAKHLADRGMASRRATEIAAHATRPARRADIAPEDLGEWWRARARAVGLSPGRVAAVVGRDAGRPVAPLDEARGAAVLAALGERGRPIARRHVVRAWCDVLPRGAPALAVTEAAERTLEVLVGPSLVDSENPEVRGVGERRHDLPRARWPRLDRIDWRGQQELERALARRGMEMDTPSARAMGRERDVDLGIGLG